MKKALNAKRLDCMQLGWLLIWVLRYKEYAEKKIDYHDMRWETLDDMFLDNLVNEGDFSGSALEQSTVIKDMEEFSSLF